MQFVGGINHGRYFSCLVLEINTQCSKGKFCSSWIPEECLRGIDTDQTEIHRLFVSSPKKCDRSSAIHGDQGAIHVQESHIHSPVHGRHTTLASMISWFIPIHLSYIIC